MIRFTKEINGVTYLITNWRMVNGVMQMSNGKCWKFPLTKKKRAA